MSVTSAYERLLVGNAARISSIESSLRSLSWFLPGRFQDSELASEALYSLLNILSLYHDSILHRSLASLPPNVRPAPSSHARYTRYWISSSTTYAALARTLTILSYSELLLEMGIKKRLGKESAEKAVMAIELAKAFMRLLLLRETKGRMGVQPAVPEREVDPAVIDQARQSKLIIPSEPPLLLTDLPRSAADVLLRVDEVPASDYWLGARTGLSRPTLASIRLDPVGESSTAAGKENLHQYLITRVLTSEDVKRPLDLVDKVRGLGKIAEIVWILRPLLYVAAMKKYGRRHAFPFLLSLSLEYLSYSLRESSRKAALSSNKASGPMMPDSLTEVEKGENAKRTRKFWWYFLRGPVWEQFTKPRLEGLSDSFEGRPLVGFVATLVRDYLPLIDDYHFYAN